MSSVEEKNKALARRLLEALFVTGDLNMLDEVLAINFVDRSLMPGQGPSREQYKQWATVAYAAFSFADFTIEDQIARGNKVITRFSTRSTHRGEFLGVPPSGEVGEYSSIHRIEGVRSLTSGARGTC